NNILHPANGAPIIVPSQDMVLGLYYLSIVNENEPGEGMVFADMGELHHALETKAVTLHTKIKGRFKTVDADGKPVSHLHDTTPGRMIIGELLPKNVNVPFETCNQEMTKKNISRMIDTVYRHCGQKETVIFCDRIMALGFGHACRAGISFGKDDMLIPDTKQKLVGETEALAKEYEQQYNDGLITQGEKYNKVVDAWAKCSEKVADEMMGRIKAVEFLDNGRQKPMNSIYMMSHSGARGSPTQMRQLAGMRGLMAKPSGEIIETPIISNFKEGLTVLEYFNSTHGARKGLADTALKTANSGYLTRRLVDVAQDCIVHIEDCGTEEGLDIRAVVEGGDVIESLAERILGRTAALPVKDPLSGEVMIEAGKIIDEAMSEAIETAGVDMVKLRSALTCESPVGICAACYGRDLARGTEVNIGEAVGVIAAQSIGEPGTQLTMRTFHIGGAAQRGAEQSSVESGNAGVIKVLNRNVVTDAKGVPVVMGRNVEIIVIDEAGRERARHRLPYGARILADDGVKVERGDRLAEWDPYMLPIIAERDGVAHFVDLVDGVSIREVTDEETGISSRVVVDWRQQTRGADLKPLIALRDANGDPIELAAGIEARYFLSVDAVLNINHGSEIRAGDVLARIPRESTKTRDITGGLPRVAELFEARRPKDHAVLAESTGRVEFGRDYKTKRRIIVRDMEDPDKSSEYMIPKGRHVAVREGDMVEKGDLLLDGNPAPHDILNVLGV
ncbi:MAG: DNA-directed RNA polymerase subunit beta', partial [Alphaproteobacteria bacterium]